MDAIPQQADLTKLEDEMELAHFANKLYWGRKIHNREASAEYQRRQERMDQIRRELDGLKSRKIVSARRISRC
jgi:hypothetical protein